MAGSPTLRQMEYAIALADHRHFGRAAEASNVSQPGLSNQIQALERRLGCVLFERTRRGAELTDIGAELVARFRTVVNEVADVQRVAMTAGDRLTGRVRIAAIPTMAPYLLPTVVRSLRALWPDVVLELSEARTEIMLDEIEAGSYDLGLLATPWDTRRLQTEAVAAESFHLAMPAGHELAGTSPVSVDALVDHEVLLLAEGHCLRDHAQAVCEMAGKVGNSDVQAASLSTLTQMVAGGLGVALLPDSAVPVEARPGAGVVTRPMAAPLPGRTIACCWRPTDPRGEHFAAGVAELRGAFAGQA